VITNLHLHTPLNRWPLWLLPGRLLIFISALAGPVYASADQGSAHQSPQLITRHTVLLMGRPVGEQVTSCLPDGSYRYHFEYSDRGRGPNLDATVAIEPNSGVPTDWKISGLTYMKAAFTESFGVANGRARWQTQGEQGERVTEEGTARFYVSTSDLPAATGLLATALARSESKSMALFPDGNARIEKLSEVEVSPKDQPGPPLKVELYAIVGLDFFPTYIWLDPNREMFAQVEAWTGWIRSGYEESADRLVTEQQRVAAAWSKALAKKYCRKPEHLAIRHAALFDADNGTVKPDMTLIVSGNKIESVSPDAEAKVAPDIEVVDGKGQTLLPGLWDMHTHFAPNRGLLHIICGVTSTRDMGNDIDTLGAMRNRIDAGDEIGPRILMAGFIDGRGPYTGPTKVFADNEEEASAAVDRYASLGYVQIKLYSSLKPALVPFIAKIAHAKGLRLSGHVPAGMTAAEFVQDGADEIQHLNFLFLNFLFDTAKETQTMQRFTAVGEHAPDIDLESPMVSDFVALLKDHKTVIDPTLVVLEELYTSRPGVVEPTFAAIAEHLPIQVRRGFSLGNGLSVSNPNSDNPSVVLQRKILAERQRRTLPIFKDLDERYRAAFSSCLRLVKKLYDADITIVGGTDTLPGYSLHRELELYTEAGIPAAKVLQLATIGAARVMRREAELGSLEPGKLADIVMVEGDPAQNISAIRNVRLVIKDGTIFDIRSLQSELGIEP